MEKYITNTGDIIYCPNLPSTKFTNFLKPLEISAGLNSPYAVWCRAH